MKNIFNNSLKSRSEIVNYAYELSEELENKLQHQKDSSQITNIYLTTVNDQLTVVEKNSLRGYWLAFTERIRKTFGMQSNCLDALTNLQKAAQIIEQVTLNDETAFESASKKASKKGQPVTSKKIRDSIIRLGIHLKRIRNHIIARKKITKQSYDNLPDIKIYDVKQLHTAITKTAKIELEEKVSDLLDTLFDVQQLKADHKQYLTQFIYQYNGNPGLAINLFNNTLSKRDRVDLLLHHLLRHLSLDTRNKNSLLVEIVNAITQIHNTTWNIQGVDNYTVENCAIVMGDAFISKSGLEGEVDCTVFTRIISDFLQEKEWPKAENLRTIFKNVISLQSNRAINDINKYFENKPQLPLLLSGGWIGHQVVYSIEQQQNDKFSFKIFNRGEGSEFFDKATPGYRDKQTPCIAIKNISKHSLFNPSFLTCLQSLSTLSNRSDKEHPSKFLMRALIPMLDGQAEELPPDIQQLVSPQRAGTCTYKSLQAFLAYYLPKEDFKEFNLEFKYYLLSKIYQKYNGQTLQHYEYAILKRALERFSQSIHKNSSYVSNDLKFRFELLSSKFHIFLSQTRNILNENAQKAHSFSPDILQSTTIESLKVVTKDNYTEYTEYATKMPSSNPKQSVGRCIAEKAISFITDLEKLQQDHPCDLTSLFEQNLIKLTNIPNIYSSDFDIALDSLLKTIPSLNDWKNVTFKNPEKALSILRELIVKKEGRIGNSTSTAHYCAWISLQEAYQQAFTQWADKSNITAPPEWSLGNDHLKYINLLNTDDPYWTHFLLQVKNRLSRQQSSSYFSAARLYKTNNVNNLFTIHPEIAKMVWSWWNLESNEMLREQVKRSIQEDRQEQEKEYLRQHAQLTAESETLLTQINSLTNAIYTEQDNLKRKNIEAQKSALQRNYSGVLNALSSLREEINKDAKYWPEGFEVLENAPKGKKSLTYKAPFFILPQNFFQEKLQKKDILPVEIRSFINNAIFSSNIFQKTQRTDYRPAEFELTIGENERAENLLKIEVNIKQTGFYNNEIYSNPPLRQFAETQSRALQSLDPSSPLHFLFSNGLLEQRINYQEEPNIPHIAHITLKNLLAEQRRIDGVLPDEVGEIFSIWNSQKVQIHAVISFFKENSRYLSNKNWFSLFHTLLFESGILLEQLEQENAVRFVDSLRDFFQKLITAHLDNDDPLTAANLCWISAKIQQHIDFAANRGNTALNDIREPIIPNSLLIRIFENSLSPKHSESRSAILEGFLASGLQLTEYDLPQQNPEIISQEVTEVEPQHTTSSLFHSILGRLNILRPTENILRPTDEIKQKKPSKLSKTAANEELYTLFSQLCVASILWNEYPTQVEHKILMRYDAAHQTRIGLLKNIQKVDSELLTEVLNEYALKYIKNHFKISEDCFLERVYVFVKDPIYNIVNRTTKNTIAEIDLSRGEFNSSNIDLLKVYDRMLSEETILTLKSQEVCPLDQDFAKLRWCRYNNQIHIRDAEKGIYYLIENSQKESHIFVKTNTVHDKWMLHIPPSNRRTFLSSECILSSYIQRKVDNTIYLCDQVTHEPIFRINFSTKSINRISDGLQLVETQKLPKFIRSFETQFWILALANKNNEVCEIHFPRHHLTLIKDGSSWINKEDRSWKLAKTQYIQNLTPEVGFLIFESPEGNREALLPIWDPDTKNDSKRSPHTSRDKDKQIGWLEFKYKYNFEDQKTRKGRISAYTIDTTGKLLPKNLESRYYLTRIYFEMGWMEESEELLFHHEGEVLHRKLTDTEIAQLEKIAYHHASMNTESRAVKLQMQAIYLLVKNKSLYPDRIIKNVNTDDIIKHLVASTVVINDYLSRLNHFEPLNLERELLVLNYYAHLANQVNLVNHDTLNYELIFSCILKRKKELSRLQAGDEDIDNNDIDVNFQLQARNKKIIKLLKSSDFHYRFYKEELEQFDKELSSLQRFKNRAYYKSLRLQGKFPFDRDVEFDTFKVYFTALLEEAKSYCTWESAIQSGFVQIIYDLTFFSDDIKVKGSSCKILSTLNSLAYFIGYKDHVLSLVPNTTQIQNMGRVVHTTPTKKNTLLEITSSLPKLIDIQITHQDKEIFLQKFAQNFTENKNTIAVSDDEQQQIGLTLFNITTPEVKDKTVKNKFIETQGDIVEAIKLRNEEKSYQLLPTSSLGEMEEILKSKLTSENNELDELENIITSSIAIALTGNYNTNVQVHAKIKTLPNINELCLVVAKLNDSESLHHHYPELSIDGIDTLQRSIKAYLVQKQFVQSLTRLYIQLQTANKYTEDAETHKLLINQLGATLYTSRAYSLDNQYALIYLLLETKLSIMLRPDQIKNIDIFVTSLNSAEREEIILQMIMGAGKTSVLQPLLAFFASKPGSISVVDVPESLYPTVREGLTKSLGDSFNHSVFAMSYDRESARDLHYLKTFYTTLQQIESTGGCFLRTPKLKHSILTSLYEAYYDLSHEHSPINDERVQLISSICLLLQEKEIVQIDEADMTMNPKIIFKYPIGRHQNINQERATFLAEILLEIASDTTFTQEVSLDFAAAFQKRIRPSQKTKGSPLSAELYETKFKEKYLEIVIEKLSKKSKTFKDLFSLEESKKILISFLCQTQEFTSQKEKYADWLRNKITRNSERDLLGVISVAYTSLLKTSLYRECGAHYGISPVEGQYLARPYAAPKAPKTTMYGNPYEQVIYTTQQYLYYGIPLDVTRKMILSLQESHVREQDEYAGMLETTAMKRYKEIMKDRAAKFNLMETPLSTELIKEFQDAINIDKQSFIKFLQDYCFTQIKIYPESISSTPHTLSGSSKHISGYTGTLSAGILPRNVTSLPEIGTDGKTIIAVQEKMKTGRASVTVYLKKDGAFNDRVIKGFAENPNLSVFIDSGGWLKEENSQQFAQRLFTECKRYSSRDSLKGVVYHTTQGELVSLELNNKDELQEVPLHLSRFKTTDGSLITIIAQKHETGTNIPQNPRAEALVSIRKGMTKRDALQSIFRMRQILLGQSVSMILTEDVKDHIAQEIWDGLKKNLSLDTLNQRSMIEVVQQRELPIDIKTALITAITQKKNSNTTIKDLFIEAFSPTSESIWRYLTANESLQEQEKNWVAATQRMREVIEKPVRLALEKVSTSSTEDRLRLFEIAKDLFIERNTDSAFLKALYGVQSAAAQQVIDQEIEKNSNILKKIHELSQQGNTAAQQAIEEIVKSNKLESSNILEGIKETLQSCVSLEDISEMLLHADCITECEIEQEVEQENEEEVEQEQEQELEYDIMNLNIPEKSYTPILEPADLSSIFNYNFSSISKLMVNETVSKTHTPNKTLPLNVSVASRILYSPNLFIDGYADSDLHLRTSFIAVLIDEERHPTQTRYVLVSHQDAAHIKQQIIETPLAQKKHVIMYDLDNIILEETRVDQTKQSSSVFINQKELQEVITLSKIYGGKTKFTKEELNILNEWLNQKNMRACELKIFYEAILKTRPSSFSHYNHSQIKLIISPASQVVKH